MITVNRNKNIICVVEDYKSLISFEKAGNYKGVYHVLNGLISPMDGKGPDDISIDSLISRVKKDDIKEAIQSIFDVIVESVNIINTEGKVKRFKGTKGKRSSVKKAVVTVKKGQDINLSILE